MGVQIYPPAAISTLWRATGTDEPPYPLRLTDDPEAAATDLPDDVAGLVAVLARSQVRVEAVQDEPDLRVIAGIAAGVAVLATQNGDGVRLRSIQADSIASAVVETLPAQRRGTLESMSMPTEELGSGGDPQARAALDLLTAVAPTRSGTVTVTARTEGGTVRRSPPLAWFDLDSGRYLRRARRGHDGREWTVIGPADATTLRQRVAELIGALTAG